MNSEPIKLERHVHDELIEMIEDCVENWCDSHYQSGEKAWLILECFSAAKQAQLEGLIT